MKDEGTEEVIAEEEEPGIKKKGKPKLLLLIILVVLGLGLGGVYYFFGHKIVAMVTGKPLKVTHAAEAPKKHAAGPILTLEPFVFNLSGASTRFAKISIGIEMKNAKAAEETKGIMPAIRDKVLLVLGGKPMEAFLDVSQRNKIKEEVCVGLKTLFKEQDDLNAVYITDIIIQ